MTYTPTTWVEGQTKLGPTNLNKIEQGVRAASRTTSAFSGGPPGSPSDGDIWIATSVDASGTCWQFQYNAGSGSAYKWEFIGGSATRGAGNANTIISSATQVGATGYYYVAGMAYTTVRAGDYLISGSLDFYANGGAAGAVQMSVFAGATKSGVNFQSPLVSATSTDTTIATADSVTGVAASTAIGLCGSGGVPGTYKLATYGWFITPVRIG